MKLVYKQSVLATALSLCLSGAAFAQDDASLKRVVVTANRSEVPVGEALASVTVLTHEDIERSQSPDLLNLLSRQAGVDVARTGGTGAASTVFLRGTNSSHTLVLVDGVRVNAATQGVFDFAHLPLSQVERIEIVRGPRAALWGSDAIGGVIQVFTRDPSKSFFEAHAGSYGRGGATVGAGVEHGESRAGLAAGFEESQGFDATTADAYGHDDDNDGYRNRNLSLRARTHIGGQQLSFSGLLTSANVDFDQGRTAVLNRVFGFSLAGRLGTRWTHNLSLGHGSEDLDTPAYSSLFGSARTSLDWTNTLALDEANTLNFGLNWSRESGYSFEGSTGFDQSRRNTGLFASWRGHFGAHLFEASLRRDDNSQFAGATTGNLAWGWQVTTVLRARASWGQGFRAPNFNELYYPGFFGLFAGNPELQPEHSRSLELGLDWQPTANQSLGLSLYRTRISDLIAFQGINFKARNIGNAAIDGAELDYHLQSGQFSFDGNATWQDARDRDTGMRLLRRANRKLFASASYRFDNQASLGIDLSAVSVRRDFGDQPLHGYGRVDLRVSLPLAPEWTVEARLENVGDREYFLVDGYNTPGRSGVINLRWNAR